jgi:hypothetical protein
MKLMTHRDNPGPWPSPMQPLVPSFIALMKQIGQGVPAWEARCIALA